MLLFTVILLSIAGCSTNATSAESGTTFKVVFGVDPKECDNAYTSINAVLSNLLKEHDIEDQQIQFLFPYIRKIEQQPFWNEYFGEIPFNKYNVVFDTERYNQTVDRANPEYRGSYVAIIGDRNELLYYSPLKSLKDYSPLIKVIRKYSVEGQ